MQWLEQRVTEGLDSWVLPAVEEEWGVTCAESQDSWVLLRLSPSAGQSGRNPLFLDGVQGGLRLDGGGVGVLTSPWPQGLTHTPHPRHM